MAYKHFRHLLLTILFACSLEASGAESTYEKILGRGYPKRLIISSLQAATSHSQDPAILNLMSPYLKHKDIEIRKAAVTAIALVEIPEREHILIGALKNNHRSSERQIIFRALSNIGTKTSLQFILKVLESNTSSTDDRGFAIQALLYSKWNLKEKLSTNHTKSMISIALSSDRWSRQASLLLSQARPTMTKNQIGILAKELLKNPELAPICKILPLELINTNAHWKRSNETQQRLLNRLLESEHITASELPSYFWDLPHKATTSPYSLVLWLKVFTKHRELKSPTPDFLMHLAENHASRWVSRQAVDTWYHVLTRTKNGESLWQEMTKPLNERTPGTIKSKIFEILAAHAPSQYLSLPIKALYGGPSLTRSQTLIGLWQRDEVKDLPIREGLKTILLNGSDKDTRYAVLLLGRFHQESDHDILAQTFRSHKDPGQDRIRLAVLDAIANIGTPKELAFYRLAAKDSTPIVQLKAQSLYEKSTGRSLNLNLQQTDPKTTPSSPYSFLEIVSQSVLVIKTTKGSFRIHFFPEVSSEIKHLFGHATSGQWNNLAFERSNLEQLRLPLTNLPVIGKKKNLRLPTKNAIAIKMGGKYDPESLVFLKSDDPKLYKSANVIGEILSGQEVIDALEPDDQINSVSLEQIVSLP